MSHQVIIIRGSYEDEKPSIEVTLDPHDMTGEEARQEATKWVKWIKKSYAPDAAED